MAIAKFHSNRGEKSALILVKANQFTFGTDPVYIPREALPEGIAEGEEFEIPNGYKLVDFPDFKTGEPRTTEDGQHLKMLAYWVGRPFGAFYVYIE